MHFKLEQLYRFFKESNKKESNDVLRIIFQNELENEIEVSIEELSKASVSNINASLKSFKRKIAQSEITLYHGTCEENSKILLKNGFIPENSPAPSGNFGQKGLLYLTNIPENALWFANNKGCDIVLQIDVLVDNLIPDPEDAMYDTVQEELDKTNKLGLPAYLATKIKIPPEKIRLHSFKNNNL